MNKYVGSKEFIKKHKKEVIDLAKEIMINFGMKNTHSVCEIYNLTFHAVKKMPIILDPILDEFSMGQIKRFIYAAVASAAAESRKSNITLKHAANKIPSLTEGNFQRWKVRHDNGEPKQVVQRHSSEPVTFLENALFSQVLPDDKLWHMNHQEITKFINQL